MNIRSVRIASLALLAGCASAQSQVPPQSWTAECRNIGPTVMEPIADRPGHAIHRSEFVCVNRGGPMDGGEGLGSNTWVWEPGKAAAVSGDAIYRRPGAIAVLRTVESQLATQMQDGRLVGWTSTGRLAVASAHGAWSGESGKGYRYTARSTGFKSFVVDLLRD